jgi:serine/threonine-protein kinase
VALSPGTRLGAYEILTLIGQGGMGEVYRARDTRLGRDVAIKVLPLNVTADRDRLARLEREAKVLASLNYPNIAHIYGVDDSSGTPALVMELVDGPTLADRIAKGPIPLDEALPMARQIAEGLEAAHEQGIIHRDLKPANIKVRDDGTVKILDFGLAKALEANVSPHISATQSPAITTPAMMTGVGMILGTAAYMSPEQAKGKAADRRSDVWAFGCVLYEMLAGQRPFVGEDASETLAAILMREPDWDALPAALAPHVRTLIARCLRKDRKARIGDLAVARFVLDVDESATRATDATATPHTEITPLRRAWPWAVAGAAVVTAVTILTLWAPWRQPPSRVTARIEGGLGADISLMVDQGPAVALSPDGSVLALVSQIGVGGSHLYVRHLDQLQATLLPGTADARAPFFSPDSQWIAFFADSRLKKISVTGGAAVTICNAINGRGGWWAQDGTIVFQPISGTGAMLQRVSSSGGTPVPLTTLEPEEATQRWPQVLPGGHAVLFTSSRIIGNYPDATVVVQSLPDGPRRVLVRGGYFGRYVASGPAGVFGTGHLVYVRDGTLFAAPFDVDRLELLGAFVPVLQNVGFNIGNGSAALAVSDTGTVAYYSGQGIGTVAPIVWMSRNGQTSPLRSTPSDWSNPQFSPDGRRLALDISDGTQTNVWTYDWTRDALTRVTLDSGEHWMPAWTPDGRRISYRGPQSGGNISLFWRRADGAEDPQLLTTSINTHSQMAWHPSGKLLAFVQLSPNTSYDVMVLPINGDETSGWKPGQPIAFANSPAVEQAPAFSPDGRWLAYQSNESGGFQIYVRPFPGPSGKWQVSTEGGFYPTWSRAHRELLYATPDNRIMTVSYAAQGDSFAADKPRSWADARFSPRVRGIGGSPGRPFDLHPDGERVAIAPLHPQDAAKQDKLVFIFNFFDELRRMAPVKK